MLEWIFFIVFIGIMLVLDLFVFHRKAHVISIKEALGWTALWISLALIFNYYIYLSRGPNDALNFLTAYIIEKSLSVDNLFIFLLIFNYFHTPKSSMHRVLSWGIIGAVILRAIFIVMGIALISKFHWMIYIFGSFLIFSGIKLWRETGKEIHPENNPLLLLFTRFFPITKEYVGEKFFILRHGIYYATPLFIVLLSVETTDVIFAIDSIPAVIAITTDPYIVFTSNIFAILGLRSLFFVLSHVMSLFKYLHYGLAIILIFTGLKMLTTDIYDIPTLQSLLFVMLVLISSITYSIYRK